MSKIIVSYLKYGNEFNYEIDDVVGGEIEILNRDYDKFKDFDNVWCCEDVVVCVCEDENDGLNKLKMVDNEWVEDEKVVYVKVEGRGMIDYVLE